MAKLPEATENSDYNTLDQVTAELYSSKGLPEERKKDFFILLKILKENIRISEAFQIPENISEYSTALTKKTVDVCNRILLYEPTKQSDRYKEEIVRTIAELISIAFNHSNIFVNILSFLREIQNREANSILAVKIERSKEIISKMEDLLKQAEANAVINEYTSIFKDESERHSSLNIYKKDGCKYRIGTAQKWIITAGTSLLAIIATIFMSNSLFSSTSPEYTKILGININLGVVVPKFVLISILIFFVKFAIKNYNVHMHLHTINKERENVLKTYQTFLSALDEDNSEARNTLLIQVAKCIYTQSNTGYVSHKESNDDALSLLDLKKLLSK